MTVEQANIYLSEARIAYHKLVTGVSPRVIVDQNGERVEFTVASKTALYNWIKELEAIVSPSTSTVVGPARFTF